MLQVTWNFKIGMVCRNSFSFFVKKFFMGIIGKQYVRMEKIPQNPLKIKKDRVSSEKLDTVG